MLTAMGKFLLFLTSYAPLLFILFVRQYDEIVAVYGHDAGLLALLVGPLLAVALALLALCIFRDNDNIHGQRRKLDGRIEPAEKETLFYFVTYIIPFVGIGTAKWTDLVSYAVIFVIIYSLYARSGLIYLNPLLSLLGFKTYKIATAERNVVLITKNQYQGNVSAEMIEMGDGVYYEPKH